MGDLILEYDGLKNYL